MQLAERHVTTDVGRKPKLDVLVDDAGDVAVDDLARQTEWRHAREGGPAGLVERVVNGHAEAELRQVARRRKTGAPRADDRDCAARRTEHRRRRLGVGVPVIADVLVSPVGEELLDVADRERLIDLFAPAGRLARRGAHGSADRGHRIRVERELPALFELACRGEVQISPAVGLHGARFLAGDVLLVPGGTDLYDLVELSHSISGFAGRRAPAVSTRSSRQSRASLVFNFMWAICHATGA